MNRKRLTNQSERRAFEAIERGLDVRAFHVSKKVGVKDVIGATKEEVARWPDARRRIWWWGHFDLVCTSQPNDEVEFVVEYDGLGHFDPTSDTRDRAKNGLCRDAGIPILRIQKDNMLEEMEQTSVVEYMAALFAAWKREGNRYYRQSQELFAALPPDDPIRADPYLDASLDPSLNFHVDHPFPPKWEVFTRLCDKKSLVQSRYFEERGLELDFEIGIPRHDYSRELKRSECCGEAFEQPLGTKNLRLAGSAVSGSNARLLFSKKRALRFSWNLPVDDEAYELIGPLSLPTHGLVWSELPGAFLPRVMDEVLEYLTMREIEKWMDTQFGLATT